MKQGLSIGLLIAGVVLIIYGINAWTSAGSEVSRFFTGAPTDKALWLLLGGIIAASAGLFGFFRARRLN